MILYILSFIYVFLMSEVARKLDYVWKQLYLGKLCVHLLQLNLRGKLGFGCSKVMPPEAGKLH